MSAEKALVPLPERTVIFYDGELTAVLVGVGEEEQFFVPVRPLCDSLGVDWFAPRKRIVGDAVLSEAVRSVVVTAAEADGRREMLCLPLETKGPAGRGDSRQALSIRISGLTRCRQA